MSFPTEDRAFLERAASQPEKCISVGGLAQHLGVLRPFGDPRPRVLGRFVEFSRRAKGWTVEQLAHQSQVSLAEIVAIETNPDYRPSTATVSQIAQSLGYPTNGLLEIAELTTTRNERLTEAAVRFAAQSEPIAVLTNLEQAALDLFAKAMQDASSQ
jgi:transcriptional regulator with XRE-family HTH domain